LRLLCAAERLQTGVDPVNQRVDAKGLLRVLSSGRNKRTRAAAPRSRRRSRHPPRRRTGSREWARRPTGEGGEAAAEADGPLRGSSIPPSRAPTRPRDERPALREWARRPRRGRCKGYAGVQRGIRRTRAAPRSPSGTRPLDRLMARIARASATPTARPAKPLAHQKQRRTRPARGSLIQKARGPVATNDSIPRSQFGRPAPSTSRRRAIAWSAARRGPPEIDDVATKCESGATRARLLDPDGTRAHASPHGERLKSWAWGATGTARPAKPLAWREETA